VAECCVTSEAIQTDLVSLHTQAEEVYEMARKLVPALANPSLGKTQSSNNQQQGIYFPAPTQEEEAMKAIVSVLGLGGLLAWNGWAYMKVAALEAKAATLEKRNDDLALKGRIVSSQLFGSPLDNFFASPEFWENTYDSGQADCAKRCIEEVSAHRKACEEIADDTERQQCFQEASDRGSECQRQCSASFPPPIP